VAQYWPLEKAEPVQCGAFLLTLLDEEVLKENTTRRLELKCHGFDETRVVTQIQYTNWPDHGGN
jgi:protein tyrosine phosphatase